MLAEGKTSSMWFNIFIGRRAKREATRGYNVNLKFNDVCRKQIALTSPVEEAVPSSICMYGGKSLQTAGYMRGER